LPATVSEIVEAHRSGAARPEDTVSESIRRIRACGDPAIFISVADEATAIAQAREAARNPSLPLCGVPVAVKDNIDAAGFPTTAACPAFSYLPKQDATAVAKLKAAGAIVVGKTNLDQFATGLVGTRSPYGPVANPFDPAYISGGSSSGSAVAVSAGLVSFALGTDPAGSGRVPAGYTNTVGLKPTRGLLSAAGVFPACRTLDCVSIFALTVDDAGAVLRVCEGEDPADAYSRARPPVPKVCSLRYGVPRADQLEFYGNAEYARLYAEGLALLDELGGERVEIDYAPLLAVANLLYEGPWVAERYAAVRDFFDARPDAFLPVIRGILEKATSYSAADAFAAQYRLEELRREIAPLWERIDCLALPTAGTIYTVAEVQADPLRLNSNLGRYTNFANLLDLSALALPNGFGADGLPAGLTLLAPAFCEERLLAIGRQFQQRRNLPLGATEHRQQNADFADSADFRRFYRR